MGRAQDEKVLSGNGAMIPNVRKARVSAGTRRPRPDAKRALEKPQMPKLSTGPSRACAGGLYVNGNTSIPVAPPRPRAYACTWRTGERASRPFGIAPSTGKMPVAPVIHVRRSFMPRSCGSVGRIGAISHPYFGSSSATGTCEIYHSQKCREGRIFGIATPFCAFFVALHRAIDLEGARLK